MGAPSPQGEALTKEFEAAKLVHVISTRFMAHKDYREKDWRGVLEHPDPHALAADAKRRLEDGEARLEYYG